MGGKVVDLKGYVLAPPEIVKAVEDLFGLFQLQNQYHMEAYDKWKGKNWFKGSFAEYFAKEEMEEVITLSEHKPWQTLVRAIYLTENVKGELSRGRLSGRSIYVPVANVGSMTKEERAEMFEMVAAGIDGYNRVSEWLAPINKENILEAVYDAVKVRVGVEGYVQFHVMKMGAVTTAPGTDLQVFDQILEIDNPEALVEYLKSLKDPPPQSIILTFVRNAKRGWKPNIFLFFLWRGTVYILDAGDRRLNLDNTAGDRNPDRYIERKFEHVWLPFDVLLGKSRPSKAASMVLRDQKVFMRGSLSKIFEKHPEIGAWMQLFMYNVADYIQEAEKKKAIPEGVSTATVLKALEDKSAPVVVHERVKTGKYSSSFESSGDASSYLVRKYGEQVKAIVPAGVHLPTVLGDRKYVENVVAFKQRENIAAAIEKLVWADWSANHERVYKWWAEFVKSKDVRGLVAKSIENRKTEYPVRVHPDFGGIWVGGKSFESMEPATTKAELKKKHAIVEPTVVKTPVVTIAHGSAADEEDPLTVTVTKTGRLFEHVPHHAFCNHGWTDTDGKELFCTREKGHRGWSHWYRRYDLSRTTSVRVKCALCGKDPWNSVVDLYFNDWLQLSAFFGVGESELPKEMVEHFHQQNETYVGNSILEDTDPADLIRDPWFRKTSETTRRDELTMVDEKVGLEVSSGAKPHLVIRIPLCTGCFKDNVPVSYFMAENVMSYHQRPRSEYGKSHDYYGHYTSFNKFANDVAVAAKKLAGWNSMKVSRPDVLYGVAMADKKAWLKAAAGSKDKLFVESEGKMVVVPEGES